LVEWCVGLGNAKNAKRTRKTQKKVMLKTFDKS
jgi:hypothetical protein